jgi:glycosidase
VPNSCLSFHSCLRTRACSGTSWRTTTFHVGLDNLKTPRASSRYHIYEPSFKRLQIVASNALVFSFMYDGIPVVYYGQEQYFQGQGDPANREPLWPSQYQDNDAVQLISSINQFRNFLAYSAMKPIGDDMTRTAADWLHQSSQILSYTEHEIVLARGPVISILTGRGSAVSASYPGI